MDRSRENFTIATGSAIASNSNSAGIFSDSESVPSSPPLKTKAIAQGAHSDSWAAAYPPHNLKYAVEHIGIFPPGDENVDNENLKYIISKSNYTETPARPRPLPMTPVIHPKCNDYGVEEVQAGHAFDDLLGNMMDSVQSESVTLNSGRDGTASESASARYEAVLSSLSYLSPRLVENRGIGSEGTERREYNWVDEAIGYNKAEAVARMGRFLAGGDEFISINDQPIIDLDHAEAPKPKKKKKNKISSKKRKQLRARKISSEGSSTAAEDEHYASQNTINEASKHTSWAGASTPAEQKHDVFPNTTDKKAKKTASESASSSAKQEHQHDASQYTAHEKAKDTSIEGVPTSDEQDTHQYTTREMSMIYAVERFENEKHSIKTLSDDFPIPPEHDFDENTAPEQDELNGNNNPDDATTSAEDGTLRYISQDTTTKISKSHTNQILSDEQKDIANSMTDTATRMGTMFKERIEKMDAAAPHEAKHDASLSDGLNGQETANINEFMKYFNSRIELHDRLFADMKVLFQSFVTELRGLSDLQSKCGMVIEDLRVILMRFHDVDTSARKKAHDIKNSQTSGAGATVDKNDVLSIEMEGTSLEISCGMRNDLKKLVAEGGGESELQKVASRVGKCQRKLNEVVPRLDGDITKYFEINNQLQGSMKAVKNDIVGLQRTTEATKSELAEVVKAVTDLDENVRAIRDTLNQIVQATHKVPTFQQGFAKYGYAMKGIGNISANSRRLEKVVDYNSDAVKKGNDEILGSPEKQTKKLNKHGERLKSCHESVNETRDAVRGHEDHLNMLNNKVNAHQKLIAKVTAQSDSNARRLHSLSDTIGRDIKCLSETTSRDIKSLTESTSRDIKETFDQLKETQVQLGTLKTKVHSPAGAISISRGDSLDEQMIKATVMKLLDPIASKVGRLCAKVEASLGPLDHIAPKPRNISSLQKKKALAAVEAAVEAQQTASQPAEDAKDAFHADILDASRASEPENKVPKVHVPQIEHIRPESMSKTAAGASPAPTTPYLSPPRHGLVAGRSPPEQMLKRSEQIKSSLARNGKYPPDGPLPARIAAENRNSRRTGDSKVFGNGMAGPPMMSSKVMDRVMMAPQNAYAQAYGGMVVAQQQVVVAPAGPGGQQIGLPPQMFDEKYDQHQFGQQQFCQQYDQQYDQEQYDQQHGQQHHDQFGQKMRYPIGHPLAIIPVDENIPPAPYIPQEDPRDNHIMLLTYNVDNLNARVNEATNAMSVAQYSILNFRSQYRYEIGQEVEREVERAMGREVMRMEARINQNLDRRINNTERRLSDRTHSEEKRMRDLLPQLEGLLRR